MYHEWAIDLKIGPNLTDLLLTLVVCQAIAAVVAGLTLTAFFAFQASKRERI